MREKGSVLIFLIEQLLLDRVEVSSVSILFARLELPRVERTARVQ